MQIDNRLSFLKHPSKSRLSLLIIEIIAFKDRQSFLIIIWHNSNKSEKILIFSQIGNAKILLIVDGSSTCPYLLVLSMFASSDIFFDRIEESQPFSRSNEDPVCINPCGFRIEITLTTQAQSGRKNYRFYLFYINVPHIIHTSQKKPLFKLLVISLL